MIRVVCWLWRDERYRFNRLFRYGPEHVNRWARAVRRNLALPHELVVVTDDPAGITEEVRVVPLWDDHRDLGGCYVRLRAFAPDMAQVIGPRFVWMDLDCVITGALDPLLDRPEDFVIWHNGISNNPYCGSMVMMTAGARRQVWDDFDLGTSRHAARRFIGTDQAWMAHRLGPDEATWTHRDGVYSRFHVGIGLRDAGLPGRAHRLRGARPHHPEGLPDGARVVFFHGPVDPSQASLQRAHHWIGDHWY